MLFVKTEVRPSEIHGLGLFAAEHIKAGTFVEAWDPSFDCEFSLEEYCDLPDSAREFLDHFGWHAAGGTLRICMDNAKYINHSSSPNIALGNGEIRALRDIAAGEEILKDYSQGASEEDKMRWGHVK